MRTSPTRRRPTTVRNSTTSAERAAADAEGTMATLQDIMTRDVYTTGGDASVADVAEIMMTQGFRHLPVVDGTKLLGIVSLRDVLRVRIRRASGSTER